MALGTTLYRKTRKGTVIATDDNNDEVENTLQTDRTNSNQS